MAACPRNRGERLDTALAVLLGLGRLHRALWVNHRYWFTTWRWGKVLGSMLLIGAALKIAMTA